MNREIKKNSRKGLEELIEFINNRHGFLIPEKTAIFKFVETITKGFIR
jgi:hypothetical protein